MVLRTFDVDLLPCSVGYLVNMKRVLIWSDFSENDERILNYARLVFERIPVTFYLVHIYNIEADGEWLNAGADEATFRLREMMYFAKKENKNPNHFFTVKSEPLPLVPALNRLIEKNGLEYLVMPTKGDHGRFDVFFGNKALHILRNIKGIPIIVVPEKSSFKSPERIVFSTNFSRKFVRKEFEGLLLLAKRWKATIEIVQLTSENGLNEFQQANKEYLREIFRGLDHRFVRLEVKSTEIEVVKYFLKNGDAGLLTLINHKYNFFRKLLQKDMVEKVTFSSPVPILILPELGV